MSYNQELMSASRARGLALDERPAWVAFADQLNVCCQREITHLLAHVGNGSWNLQWSSLRQPPCQVTDHSDLLQLNRIAVTFPIYSESIENQVMLWFLGRHRLLKLVAAPSGLKKLARQIPKASQIYILI
jgi:hypothetical protein